MPRPNESRNSDAAFAVGAAMTDVFVVAPIRVHRESLSTVLNQEQSLSVVGSAATVAEAVARVRGLGPDVAVLDAPLPEDVDLSPQAIADPGLKFVAIGVSEDEALDWIEAGVSGCVAPEASVEELAAAVARVARGELVTPPEITARLISRIRRLVAEAPHAAEEGRLTPRQTEVLVLVAQGLSNKEIAQRLSIQEQTVKNHMHRILRKLGVHRRAEAAAQIRRRRHRSPDN
jgi:DNA-binding NarL/FixJ family response regulator